MDPDLDGKAMDEGELHRDNRDTEDMDMSDEEADAAAAATAAEGLLQQCCRSMASSLY